VQRFRTRAGRTLSLFTYFSFSIKDEVPPFPPPFNSLPLYLPARIPVPTMKGSFRSDTRFPLTVFSRPPPLVLCVYPRPFGAVYPFPVFSGSNRYVLSFTLRLRGPTETFPASFFIIFCHHPPSVLHRAVRTFSFFYFVKFSPWQGVKRSKPSFRGPFVIEMVES